MSMMVLNPRERRKAMEIEIDMGDGTCVLARKMDMTLLVFEGLVPMPMLTAVQRMVEMPDASPADRVAALGSEGKSMVDLLRKHAAAVVLQPKIVFEDSDDLDVLPASYLDIAQLMAIWTATAVTPKFGPSAAARFRSGAGADDASPVPDGEDVPPVTEHVAAPTVEYVGG